MNSALLDPHLPDMLDVSQYDLFTGKQSILNQLQQQRRLVSNQSLFQDNATLLSREHLNTSGSNASPPQLPRNIQTADKASAYMNQRQPRQAHQGLGTRNRQMPLKTKSEVLAAPIIESEYQNLIKEKYP